MSARPPPSVTRAGVAMRRLLLPRLVSRCQREDGRDAQRTELAASPELAGRCLAGLDNRQALRAITVLGRAAADQEAAVGLLERLLPLVEQVVAGLPADLGLLTASGSRRGTP